MLSINRLKNDSPSYFSKLAAQPPQPGTTQYYYQSSDGQEAPGTYYGQGAEQLGLQGLVDAATLENLVQGFSPNGERKLRQNAGQGPTQYTTKDGKVKTREPELGWDFTFSAPKSLSVIWSQADEPTRKAIERCEIKAVNRVLDYIESVATTRRGKGGKQIEPAKLVTCRFRHTTSRDQDPQLHSHTLIMNVGLRDDGTYGTLQLGPILKQKMLLGALYRAELAKEVREQLGYQPGPHHKGKENLFDFQGVDDQLLRVFSKRREGIEAELKEMGRTDAVAAALATVKTRAAKQTPSHRELLRWWQAVGKAYGYNPPTPEFLKLTDEQRAVHQSKAAERALPLAMKSDGRFTRTQLMRHIAEQAPRLGLGIDDVISVTDQYLDSDATVCLGRVQGSIQYSTPPHLALEKEMMQRIDASAEQQTHTVPATIQHSVLGKMANKLSEAGLHLTASQIRGYEHMVGDNGGILVVVGLPGTAKTTTLNAARQAWEASGYEVLGCAPSGVAAVGLTREAKMPSSTIHRLLYQLRDNHVRLTSNHVIVMDEAGMTGTREFAQLVRYTTNSGSKLVLIGDDDQLQSVEAGGGFRYAKERLKAATMDEIVRQNEAWRVASIHDLLKGEAAKTLQAYAERGFLNISNTWETARDQLVATWTEQGVHNPKDHLILAGQNIDVVVLNRKAQAARLRAGLLDTQRVLHLDKDIFHVGDRIICTRNSPEVKNGQFGEIVALRGQRLQVRLDDGEQLLALDTQTYPHIKLGYAITTHKSQCLTVKQDGYVLLGGTMQNKQLTNVQLSRPKGNVYLFTDTHEAGEELDLCAKLRTSQQKALVRTVAAKHKRPHHQQRTTHPRRRRGLER